MTDEAAPTDTAVAALQPRLVAAAATARQALDGFGRHLQDDVLPTSEGDGRLGPELFAAKMRHTMGSEALTPDRILAAAEREFAAIRGEMVRLAGEIWPAWRGDQEPPTDEVALVRGVLDAIADRHQAPEDLLAFCRAEHARIEAFCTERDLIGMVDDPMDIRWTPTFLRQYGGAMLIAPGPLDRGLATFFAITPIPDDWTPEQRESYLREDNDRMLRLLTIHEAVPGHYLQSAYATREPSLPRSDLLEWRVRRGLGGLRHPGDDGCRLRVGRSGAHADPLEALPALGDQRDHRRPHPHPGDDRGRGRLAHGRRRVPGGGGGACQVPPRPTLVDPALDVLRGLAGDVGHRARSAAARGDRAGADPDAIRPGPLPGGYGETPGFRYRDHLEAVIGHGAPPTSLLRRILFD